MFIELCKNNGIPYLRLVQSYRVEDSRGRKVSRKRTILNIGPLSRFDDGKPDFVQRLKDSYKKGTPIIDSLIPYVEAPVPEKHVITFTDGDAACIGMPKLAAPLLLDRLFGQLGLDTTVCHVEAFPGTDVRSDRVSPVAPLRPDSSASLQVGNGSTERTLYGPVSRHNVSLSYLRYTGYPGRTQGTVHPPYAFVYLQVYRAVYGSYLLRCDELLFRNRGT